jgi:hypothetical protein
MATAVGSSSVVTALASVVGARVGDEAARWLTEALASVQAEPRHTRLAIAFARSGRKLGTDAMRLLPPEQDALRTAGIGEPRPHWTAADYGRLALLHVASTTVDTDEAVPLVERLFRTAEMGEQISILRVLAALPDPGRFAALAAEATRTNAVRVFEALACENVFPAAYMPDASFDQMVLKAIFVGLSTKRIEGLGRRVTAQLVRMAEGYASERRAAGRTVPDDIAHIEALLREPS